MQANVPSIRTTSKRSFLDEGASLRLWGSIFTTMREHLYDNEGASLRLPSSLTPTYPHWTLSPVSYNGTPAAWALHRLVFRSFHYNDWKGFSKRKVFNVSRSNPLISHCLKTFCLLQFQNKRTWWRVRRIINIYCILLLGVEIKADKCSDSSMEGKLVNYR